MRGTARPAAAAPFRVAVLAGLVLAVLTAGTASAVVLEAAARAPASAPALGTAAVVQPLVLAQSDTVVQAWEFPATAVDVTLEPAAEAAPERPTDAGPAPEAAAPADPLCSGAGWQQRRGEAALESLRRPADATAFSVSFAPGRSGVLGLAAVHEGRMQVFVRSCAALPDGLLRHVVAHELGHLVDGARMTDALRAEWLAVRGIPAGTPWFGCSACTDFATPAGDFAEVYAQWQTGVSRNRSELAGSPSPSELAELAARFF